MSHYVGYISVPHGSYQQWRDATLGNGYDTDGYFGEQCFDYISLLYYQYGLFLRTKAGGGLACDCWLYSRDYNSQDPFESLTGANNIKRGDVLVWNVTGYYTGSHIAIADEAYDGSGYIWVLGQNQVGNGSGYPVTRARLPIAGLLGMFRNKQWQGEEPEPIKTGYNINKYKFVLFNRRKRQEKWTKKPLKRR